MARIVRIAACAALLLALAACTPDPVATQGEEVRSLYRIFFAAAAVVFVIVSGLIAFSIIRFRRRAGDDELPVQRHQHIALEVAWFALPTLLVLMLFIVSARSLGIVTNRDPDPSVTVEVEAFQWGWRFDYGAGAVVTGIPSDPAEIVLPVGEPVVFELNSRDVVHAFYVPRFLGKIDVVPGRENRVDVTITRAGTYGGVCAEFCGLFHDRMTFKVRAVPAAEFARWLDGLREGG